MKLRKNSAIVNSTIPKVFAVLTHQKAINQQIENLEHSFENVTIQSNNNSVLNMKKCSDNCLPQYQETSRVPMISNKHKSSTAVNRVTTIVSPYPLLNTQLSQTNANKSASNNTSMINLDNSIINTFQVKNQSEIHVNKDDQESDQFVFWGIVFSLLLLVFFRKYDDCKKRCALLFILRLHL